MLVRYATPEDWGDVESLLCACALPLDGAREHFAPFIVYEDDGRLLGCAGAEA